MKTVFTGSPAKLCLMSFYFERYTTLCLRFLKSVIYYYYKESFKNVTKGGMIEKMSKGGLRMNLMMMQFSEVVERGKTGILERHTRNYMLIKHMKVLEWEM